MSEDMQRVWGPDGKANWFPKSMSDEDISKAMEQEYPSPDVTKDMINSGIQGVRNVAEGLIAAPGIADDIENSVVNWLKSQGDDTVLGRTGNAYDRLKTRLHTGQDENSIALPNYGDVQWLEKQAGLRDQYQPQTPEGNLAYGGAVAGLGGAIAGPPAIGAFGRLARSPYAQQLGRGALQGAGMTGGAGGAYGLYKLWNQLGGQ